MILNRSHILIPDTDDDLTWHAFLGHSIDMQGFRAAEFAGVDPLTRNAPKFVPLKTRGIGVPQLAGLWEVPEIRHHLLGQIKDVPFAVTLGILRTHGGEIGVSLAEAFEYFPWRKFHWSVRALLQNSAVLKPFEFSFRRWLQHECERLGVQEFPPSNFSRAVTFEGTRMALERALTKAAGADLLHGRSSNVGVHALRLATLALAGGSDSGFRQLQAGLFSEFLGVRPI